MCAADRAGVPSFDSQDPAENIVQGFGVVVIGDSIPAGRRVVSTSAPWRVVKGVKRAEAVAAHLRVQNRELAQTFAEGGISETNVVVAMLAAVQAGAAATETLADLLEALIADDQDAAREVLKRFVNDAVDTGVVLV
jgi:hypothetical protein